MVNVRLGEAIKATREYLARYIVVGDQALDALAVWIAHTYMLPRLPLSTYLSIVSLRPGCGKTTALNAVMSLVKRPIPGGAKLNAASLTNAIVCTVEGQQTRWGCATVAFDEVPASRVFSENTAIILQSNRPEGAHTARDGTRYVYSAFAFSTNGDILGDLRDRALIIDMQQARPAKGFGPIYDPEQPGLAKHIRRLFDAALPVDENEAGSPDANHTIPLPRVEIERIPQIMGLSPRDAETIYPLLAVAQYAGLPMDGLIRMAVQNADIRAYDVRQGVRVRGTSRDSAQAEKIVATAQAILADKERIEASDLFTALRRDVLYTDMSDTMLGRLLAARGVEAKTVRIGKRTPRVYAASALKAGY